MKAEATFGYVCPLSERIDFNISWDVERCHANKQQGWLGNVRRAPNISWLNKSYLYLIEKCVCSFCLFFSGLIPSGV